MILGTDTKSPFVKVDISQMNCIYCKGVGCNIACEKIWDFKLTDWGSFRGESWMDLNRKENLQGFWWRHKITSTLEVHEQSKGRKQRENEAMEKQNFQKLKRMHSLDFYDWK